MEGPKSRSNGVGINRLDSHVVAALQALAGATPGEALDMALSSSGSCSSSGSGSGSGSYASAATAMTSFRSKSVASVASRSTRTSGAKRGDPDDESGSGSGGMGLGMGMGMRLDSVYSLITNTAPRSRIQRSESRSSAEENEKGTWHRTGDEGYKERDREGERVGSLLVTDRDTGHKLDLSLSRLGEMSYL